MKRPLPTVLAVSLLLLAGAAWSAPVPSAAGASAHAAGTAHATPSRQHSRPLDLHVPNFTSPEWQRRLQGPTIDDSEFDQMQSVVVTPSEENKSNLTVAPAGVGSLYWALTHPSESWRILMPTQPGDEFNTQREIALAYNDPWSDCPGFPGTQNVRPECN